MEPYKHRILFCTNTKEEGKTACTTKGCQATLEALEAEIKKRGLQFEVKVTKTSCLGLCQQGPNLVVLPEGAWYSCLTSEHVVDFVDQHLVKGQLYESRVWKNSELQEFFDRKILAKKKEAGLI